MNLAFKSLMVAGALGLAGCASAPEPRPRATAAAETVRVSMEVSAIDNGLTWNQIDVIEAVAAEYKARGHGPLVISYPQNAGNADAAIGAIAEARTRLYEAGLDWRQISGGAYEAGGQISAPVIFSFTRYEAIAPECSTDWTDMARARPNETWPRFGCATANNLASMVADPRDLVAPRTMDAPDSARRQGVLDNYRQGQSTASERSDRESGAISSSVGN